MDKIQTKGQQGRVADAPSVHWVYSALPRKYWPYAQIARWDRPIGWWLLLWPCLWGAALAAAANKAPATIFDALPNLWHIALFTIGAIAMRGAGCTYNDLVDKDIDSKVARTRSRPLPSGQITSKQAKVFLVGQALIGFLVLIQFNIYAILLGIASLVVVAAYPFMKRVTSWPQLVLGLAFSWGALMGWAAVFGKLDTPALFLYAGAVLWTIGYDTIYAHQDREDDAIVGVRSTALLFGKHTKIWLAGFYAGMVYLVAFAIVSADASMVALAGLAAAAFHLSRQIMVLDIENSEQCLALFRANHRVGMMIFIGLVGGSLWHFLNLA